MKSMVVLVVGLLACVNSFAHIVSGSGLLHPISGIDHLLAMVAVGA
jgi:hydrogenase/urease accessory protein HupE